MRRELQRDVHARSGRQGEPQLGHCGCVTGIGGRCPDSVGHAEFSAAHNFALLRGLTRTNQCRISKPWKKAGSSEFASSSHGEKADLAEAEKNLAALLIARNQQVPQVQFTDKDTEDVPVVMQQVPVIQSAEHPGVPQTQNIDKTVDVPVLMQRQVPNIRTVQKTVEVPVIQNFDRVVDVHRIVSPQVMGTKMITRRATLCGLNVSGLGTAAGVSVSKDTRADSAGW